MSILCYAHTVLTRNGRSLPHNLLPLLTSPLLLYLCHTRPTQPCPQLPHQRSHHPTLPPRRNTAHSPIHLQHWLIPPTCAPYTHPSSPDTQLSLKHSHFPHDIPRHHFNTHYALFTFFFLYFPFPFLTSFFPLLPLQAHPTHSAFDIPILPLCQTLSRLSINYNLSLPVINTHLTCSYPPSHCNTLHTTI